MIRKVILAVAITAATALATPAVASAEPPPMTHDSVTTTTPRMTHDSIQADRPGMTHDGVCRAVTCSMYALAA